MSIYGSGKGGWKDYNDVVQPVMTPRTNGDARQPVDARNDWSDARKASPAEYLLPVSVKWVNAFPPESRPSALASEYPRICNLIAAQWNDHRGAPKLFEALLSDHRGGRAGFPPAVTRDLTMVQAYWYSGALKL